MATFFSKVLDFVGIEEMPEREDRGYESYDQPAYERGRGSERSRADERRYYDEPRGREDERARYERGGYEERNADYGRYESDRSRKRGGKVVNHPSAMDQGLHHMKIYQMEDYDDARTVIDDLLADRSVLINLELVDVDVSQRIVDMLSGATYALGASLKKAAANTYLLAPMSVDVSGSYEEEERRRGGSFFGGRR